MEELRRETANDSTMVKLAEMILEGWPNYKHKVPKCIGEYWSFRVELVVCDGLILKGQAITVPQALPKNILAQIHEGHLSREVCSERETWYFGPECPNRLKKW